MATKEILIAEQDVLEADLTGTSEGSPFLKTFADFQEDFVGVRFRNAGKQTIAIKTISIKGVRDGFRELLPGAKRQTGEILAVELWIVGTLDSPLLEIDLFEVEEK